MWASPGATGLPLPQSGRSPVRPLAVRAAAASTGHTPVGVKAPSPNLSPAKAPANSCKPLGTPPRYRGTAQQESQIVDGGSKGGGDGGAGTMGLRWDWAAGGRTGLAWAAGQQQQEQEPQRNPCAASPQPDQHYPPSEDQPRSLADQGWDLSPGADARTQLKELRVQDFALVQQQAIAFQPGLNAVTGESGSGKSVLVEALNQLLGGPAPPDCVRDPADTAVVEGRFALGAATASVVRAMLLREGVPRKALPAEAPGELTVRREILRHGSSSPGSAGARAPLRSRCFVNDAPVTLRTLRALAPMLVDMNGQHGTLALREPATQMALLDRVAGTAPLIAEVDRLIGAMQQLETRLDALDALGDPVEREARRKMVDAVRRARIQPGEEVALRASVRAMDAQRSLAEGCAALRTALAGDPGSGGGLQPSLRALETQLRALVATAENRPRSGPVAPAQSVMPAAARARARSRTPPPGALVRTTLAPVGAQRRARSVSASRTPPREGSIVDNGGAQAATPRPHGRAEEPLAAEKRGGEDAAGDDELAPLRAALDALGAARAHLGAAETHVRGFTRSAALDVEEHDAKAERLAMIEKLLRVHRLKASEELLDAVAEAEAALEQYEEFAAHEGEWEAELDALRDEALRAAVRLSAARRVAGPVLARRVEACLADLAMGSARVAVAVGWREEPQAGRLPDSEALDVPIDLAASVGEVGDRAYRLRLGAGLDVVELRLAAGPGEPLRPLASVASGGESARVMLALKAAPAATAAAPSADSGPVAAALPDGAPPAPPVLVLDELDSGIGSRLGGSVGALLRRMAGGCGGPAAPGSQIICVTHLPQVACHAQHHVRVVKDSGPGGRVLTRFDALLDWGARVQEVADMLSMDVGVADGMLRTAQQQQPASNDN